MIKFINRKGLFIKIMTVIIFISFGRVVSAQHNASLLTRSLIFQIEKFIKQTDVGVNRNYNLPSEMINRFGIKKKTDNYTIGSLISINSTNEKSVSDNLLMHNIKIFNKIGSIWSVEVPIQNLKKLCEIPGITSIEVSGKGEFFLDQARMDTRTDLVNDGFQLSIPYNGTGVIVGIVDIGFDFTHPMFKDQLGNNLRISRVWIKGDDNGVNPYPFNYGSEYVGETNILNKKYDGTTFFSHGSHVAGIAAGSGYGSNNLYRGVASEAELVLVPVGGGVVGIDKNQLIDALSYIFSYATSQGKPAVVNMSLGFFDESRDGNSLFEQAIDNLISGNHILIVSTGNSGGKAGHVEKEITSSSDTLKTMFNFSTWGDDIVNTWGEIGQTFSLSLQIFDETGNFKLQTPFYSSADTTDILLNFLVPGKPDSITLNLKRTILSPVNAAPKFNFSVLNNNWNYSYSALIIIAGSNGKIHSFFPSGFTDTLMNGVIKPNILKGDGFYSVAAPASCKKTIGVGAYTTKNTYTNLKNQNVQILQYKPLGEIAPFSSKGPTIDGRLKPQVVGPGNVVVSGSSSYDYFTSDTSSNAVYKYTQGNKSWLYIAYEGTSMSSPFVVGVVALMLEANPNLSYLDVIDILKNTSRQDSFTGVIPPEGSNTWGYGKIDAYNAVKDALLVGIKNGNNNLPQILVFPNPSDGIISISNVVDNFQKSLITISDITGKTIKEYSHIFSRREDHIIDLQNQPQGMYFINIKLTNQVLNYKVVLQK